MNSTLNLPKFSIVIPNYNGAVYLENCLKSLKSQTYQTMEIVVVDNASQDGSVDLVRALAPEAVLLRENRNCGFAEGADIGIHASRGDWVAVLNNDTEAGSHWLAACMQAIQNHPDAAFLACRILDFSIRDRLYSAGDCFLRAGIGYRRGQEQTDREDFRRECKIFSASGCAALYRRDVLKQTGVFDKRFFAYLEDVDLGLRLQAAGYHGYYVPGAEVYHHGAATSGGEFTRLSVRLRTRNSLLILLKSMPGGILFRCLPMIMFAQLAWLLRVIIHRRMISYLSGLAGAVLLTPAMILDRAGMRPYWRLNRRQLWQTILESESMVSNDLNPAPGETVSLFLRWYFRIFKKRVQKLEY
jgi:GT2 family glycosyltransferase